MCIKSALARVIKKINACINAIKKFNASTSQKITMNFHVIKLRRSLTVIWYFCLFMLSTLHLALGILRCPTRWQWSFCATATPSINISPSAWFATMGTSSSWSYVGLWGSIRFFLFPLALPSGAWGFLLSLNHDWFPQGAPLPNVSSFTPVHHQ